MVRDDSIRWQCVYKRVCMCVRPFFNSLFPMSAHIVRLRSDHGGITCYWICKLCVLLVTHRIMAV